jgi:PAS domain S-box-containing protein
MPQTNDNPKGSEDKGDRSSNGSGPRAIRVRTACFVCLVGAVLVPVQTMAQANGSDATNILMLNSYHAGYEWTDDYVQAAQNHFHHRMPQANLYVEYMDTKRHGGREHLEEYQHWLLSRYEDTEFDLIITADDNALRFVANRNDELWPDAPVVFCGINNYDPNLLAGKSRYVGMRESSDVRENVRLARRIQPRARRVYVISDQTPTGLGFRQTVRSAEPDLPRLEFIYLNGEDLTTAELIERLQGIPTDSIVLFMIWLKDSTGRYMPYRRWLPRISKASPVPLWGTVDLWLGHGLLGGKLKGGGIEGRAVARMAEDVLSGRLDPDEVSFPHPAPTRFAFDHEQMQRFAISTDDLPEGSVIINEPFNVYREYREIIWSAVAAGALLVVLIAGLAANVMKRRLAERELRRQRQSLEAILQQAPYGVMLVGPELADECTYTNATFTEITGLDTADIPTLGYWFDRAVPDPEQRDQAIARWRQYVADGFPAAGFELTVNDPAGRERTLHIRANPVDPQRIVVMLADITEQLRAEEDNRRLTAQIQHTQKLESLGVLAGGIAHDFNNLLVGILGNADLALMEMSELAPARPSVEEIKRVSIRASDLTNQMLAYSGKGRFVVRPLDLNELVDEMLHLLEVSMSKKAVLQRDLADDLPLVEADASQIRQIAMNLVTNASDAIGEASGTITIRTRAFDADERYFAELYTSDELSPGRYVSLEVTDTGCGMDEETRRRVFDPFFTTKFAGRGLGLAAVLGIVRGHSGAINVYSEPGKGTTFKVLLPALSADTRLQEPEIEQTETDDGPVQNTTVLMADDEQTVRNVAGEILRRRGFGVIEATDGREAVEIYRDRMDEIDVVLLDLTMPHMDGEETFREIRRINPHAKVLLASGYNEQDTLSRFVGKGLAGFVAKPFEGKQLVGRILAALRSDQSDAAE